jgi:hypothetical protein
MTQILSGICSEGIMVATDSMATKFDAEENETHFVVEKLFSVSSHAFVVSGGMGVSVELSKSFKLYAEERQLVGIEEIFAAAGPYLSDQYREALRTDGRRTVTGNQLERIFFVLGGYSFRSKDKPFQLALWGSEAAELPLQRIKIGPSLTVPRSMFGEVRLFEMCKRNCKLVELLEFAQAFLEKQAGSNPQIGPPFIFGTVTSEGFKRVEKSTA